MEKHGCKNIAESLSAFIDGEIGAIDEKALEEHLASCEACSAELEELKKLDELTGRIEPPAVSKDEWAGMWEKISEEMTIVRRPSSIWTWAGLIKSKRFLASAAAVIIAIVLIFAMASTPDTNVAENIDEDDDDDVAINYIADGYRAYIISGEKSSIIAIVAPDSDEDEDS